MKTLIENERVPIKLWSDGLDVEPQAMQQIRNVASLPIVGPHVAIMPDVHWGIGATVGSVIPTRGAIIPAAVGVDIGCGMIAARTSLDANELTLTELRAEIEEAIPVGGPGVRGSWDEAGRESHRTARRAVEARWNTELAERWVAILKKHPKVSGVTAAQLGTLGTGNHFIEVCLEEGTTTVWLMLHSGSRGPGNRIGTYFISRAKEAWLRAPERVALGDPDLAWLSEGESVFDDYVEAVGWAQDFAAESRRLMMQRLVGVLEAHVGHRFQVETAANCHHNYVRREEHGGESLYVTRKGAVSARAGEVAIIPGSMGARSFIVRGRGAPDSFASCSHGAGRRLSRGRAKREITVDQHLAATAGVECRKDAGVLDESPAAYKSIEAVMQAQEDLVEIAHVLKQVICVKG